VEKGVCEGVGMEEDGKERSGRGRYRESEKKNLLCQQIQFGFGSPVHRVTPN
jgi:hypothetical protein